MAALESLVPVELENHLQMNASKFDTYESMRNEVVSYAESRTGARIRTGHTQQAPERGRGHQSRGGDDPMDVDSLQKGAGKGKFTGACRVCGKVGHKAAECWSNGASAGSHQNPQQQYQ